MAKQIAWEKYIDPWGKNIADVEWGMAQETPKLPGDSQVVESEDGETAYHLERDRSSENTRVLMTPHGLLTINEYNSPTKCFNLWTGHTNFCLSHALVQLIESVEGVEILRPFSQYRFMIGFGKLFDSSEVKLAIAKALGVGETTPIDEDTKLFRQTIAVLSEKKVWAALMLPNGSVVTVSGDAIDDDIRNKIAVFKTTQAGVGGMFASSEDQTE